jgi:Xaa-Pro aminopeptidase
VGKTLAENNVVTVEPGLYYPELGGVRLEDLVVVKEGGCENLTSLEKRLIF